MESLSEWSNILKKLKHYSEPPNEAFINPTSYAQRCGDIIINVRKAVMRGFFKSEDLCTIPLTRASGRLQLLINWNTTGYNYAFKMKPSKRLSDFVQNKDRVYKPISTTRDPSTVKPKSHKKKKKLDNSLADIVTIGDAKLEQARLKILQERAAIQLAENEVLAVADVVDICTAIGHETKAQIMRAINLCAPKVATTTDVRECRRLMERYLKAAFDNLLPLIMDAEGLFNASGKTSESEEYSRTEDFEDDEIFGDSEIV